MAIDPELEEDGSKKEIKHIINQEAIEMLRRIEARVSELPDAQEIKVHIKRQEELYHKSSEGWKLEEDSRNLLKAHIEDMNGLRKMHTALMEQTSKLSSTQDKLVIVLENINDNLKNGFELGTGVVKLFGKIVIIFLASLIVLSLVIVWVAKIDITHESGKTKITHQSTNEPAEAPKVDFEAPNKKDAPL